MESISWSMKDPEQFLECVISEQAEPANTELGECSGNPFPQPAPNPALPAQPDSQGS